MFPPFVKTLIHDLQDSNMQEHAGGHIKKHMVTSFRSKQICQHKVELQFFQPGSPASSSTHINKTYPEFLQFLEPWN